MTALQPFSGSTLARVIQPLDEPTFLREYWGAKPAMLRGDAGRFEGLFGLNDLEEYLFIARPTAGEVQIIRNGEWAPMRQVAALLPSAAYDLQSVHTSLADGFTIVLNAIHTRWPAARRLVDDVEDRLLARGQTNVYITGPRGQGFAVHADDHDVFVLQTCGTKKWYVYDRPSGSPAERSKPILELELQCGDVLYLPVGFPHAAETLQDLSIHVSLGLFPMTWQTLAHACIDTIAGSDPHWSAPVPLDQIREGGHPVATAHIASRIDAGLAALADTSSVMEQYRRGLGSTARRRNPPPSGYMGSVGRLDQLGPDSEVERRPGVDCFVTADEAYAVIHFMGESIRAPRRAERALRFIASARRFRIDEMGESLSDSSKVVLARKLVREGLLQTVIRSA